MNKYTLYLNAKRCIGCHGCEVHCKTSKGLPVGPYLCEIDHEPMTVVKGVPRTEFSFRSCHHCDSPVCVTVCPTEAMVKREDGIVSFLSCSYQLLFTCPVVPLCGLEPLDVCWRQLPPVHLTINSLTVQ